MPLFSDIIRIPERSNNENITFDLNNKINYWKLYENSFQKSSNIFNFEIKDDNYNINKFQDFIEYIDNIKYNYHGLNSDKFKICILQKYIKSINSNKKDEIKKIISDVFNFKNEQVHILKLYFNCIDLILQDIDDKTLINDYLSITNEVIEFNLNEIKVSNPAVIIKVNIQLDKFFKIVPDRIQNKLMSIILKNNFIPILLECFRIDFNNTMKIIFFDKWQSLFKKVINCITLDDNIINIIFDKINIKYSQDKYTNNKLSLVILNNFKLFNDAYDTECDKDLLLNKISKGYEDLQKQNDIMLKYLCASIHDLISTNNLNLIFEFIKFQQFNKDKISFFVTYKQFLQKRCFNSCNIEQEIKIYDFLKKKFSQPEYSKYLETIINSINDIQISNLINKEVKNLEVIIKNPEFIETEFNKNKLKVTVISNILWNNIKSNNFDYNPVSPNELAIYSNIMNAFYTKKYENRILKISHDDSHTVVSIRNLTLKLPLSHYYVLKFIANESNFEDFVSLCESDENHPESYNKYISNKLNIPLDLIDSILTKLISNKLLVQQDNLLVFNQEICKNKKKIDLTKKLNIKSECGNITKEISYDKETLIDCYLINIIKKNIKVSYGKYIYLLRKSLSKYFIPNDKMVQSRIKRACDLEYIIFSEEAGTYEYIP